MQIHPVVYAGQGSQKVVEHLELEPNLELILALENDLSSLSTDDVEWD